MKFFFLVGIRFGGNIFFLFLWDGIYDRREALLGMQDGLGHSRQHSTFGGWLIHTRLLPHPSLPKHSIQHSASGSRPIQSPIIVYTLRYYQSPNLGPTLHYTHISYQNPTIGPILALFSKIFHQYSTGTVLSVNFFSFSTYTFASMNHPLSFLHN